MKNGRDGGGRRADIPLTYSPFHFFYFSLFLIFSFLFPCLFIILFFCNYFFLFQRYFKISKEFTRNKDMEEFFRGGLKRACQNVKCNV